MKKDSIDTDVNKQKSYGINIIKERFELINKTQVAQYKFDITDSTNFDTGTKVIISITKS